MMERPERLAEAIAAHKSGDLLSAEEDYQWLITHNPGDAEALNAYGILHLQCERPNEAINCFERAIKLAPDIAKYHNNIAGAHLALRRIDSAIKHFSQAVELEQGNADYRANLGTVHMDAGHTAMAEEHFGQALTLNSDHYQALQNLGNLLGKLNRPNDALPYLKRAASHPEHQVESVFHLASTYERLNRLDEAAQTLQRSAEPTHPWARVLGARLLRRNGDAEGGLTILRTGEIPDTESLNEEIVGNWHHELALCGDQAGETASVFKNLMTAKALWRKADQKREERTYLEYVRNIRRATSNTNPFRVTKISDFPSLLFFVGFPRSGTTLMEAMLKAHPDITTTAEEEMVSPLLDGNGQPTSEDAPKKYLNTLSQHIGGLAPGKIVVDKLPLNLVHCHAIDAMFPQSRLLVALRDPRDVVLSCLMQRFQRNSAMRNFDTLIAAVTLYEEVMGLWLDSRDTLSIRWLEYRYEDLIANQETTVNHVLDFIGLERDAAMDKYREQAASGEVTTPSYRDVFEPIYDRAIGRWRAYENHLKPVLTRLEKFADALGYEI